MALTVAAVTVGTTAVALSGPDTDGVFGSSIVLLNNGASAAYVGPAGVTAATGYPLPVGGAGLSLDLKPNDNVYAITASGTTEVRVLAEGV